MVLNNLTIEKINYVKDIDMDYNIKLILICLVLLFSIACLFLSKKIDRSDAMNDTFYKIIVSISSLFILFSFLTPFLLLRTVPVDLLLKLTFVAYSIFISMGLLYWLYWSGKTLLSKFFGVKFNSEKRQARQMKDYRSYK